MSLNYNNKSFTIRSRVKHIISLCLHYVSKLNLVRKYNYLSIPFLL